MTVYVIGMVKINDRAEYRKYEAEVIGCITGHGGKIVAVDNDVDVREGEWPFERAVMIAFENRAACNAWYESEQYQRIIRYRWAGATSTMIIVNGPAQ